MMRRITLALLALALLFPGLGCMAVSSNVRGVCTKTVVAFNDQLYVVDVNKRVARRVTIAEANESTGAEVITIEAQN